MAPTRQQRRSRLTLVLLVLTSITLISLDYGDVGPLGSVRRVVLAVTSPVRGFFDDNLTPAGDLWQGITSYDDLEAENAELRAELEELRGTEAAEESAQRTLEQLLDEVDIPYVGAVDTVTARVVAGPVANTGATVDIDKGSSASISSGMSAITSGGLVGSIELVAPRRSVVRLITDAGFRVGVRIDESLLGVARGQGPDEPLLVEVAVDPTHPIRPGMVVTTSGLERSRFPAGVPVGRVLTAETDDAELIQRLTVEPLADLDALGFVTVMLWEPES